METVFIYVLTESKLLKGNEISDRVISVTTDLAEAEEHRAKGAEFDFKEFFMPTILFVAGAETTIFLKELRGFRKVAQEMQQMLVAATLEGQQ